jgi:hypothetical protein
MKNPFVYNPTPIARREIDDTFSNIVRSQGATSWDTDAVYALDAAEADDDDQRVAINSCITKLKAASCWDGECIAFYPLIGNVRNINFYDPRDLDVANCLEYVGSFTEASTGNRPISGAYAKTFVDFNLQARTNSILMMVYNRTATAPTATDEILMGAGTGFQGPHIDIHNTNQIDCALSHTNAATSPVTTSGTLSSVDGMLAVSSYGPANVSIYHDAKLVTQNTNTHYGDWSNSSPAANRQPYLWAANGNGTAQHKADREFGFAAFFLGQTKKKYVRIFNAVYQLMVDLGRDV